MKISLISVGSRSARSKRGPEDILTGQYIKRAGRYVNAEGLWVDTEVAFLTAATAVPGRMPTRIVLMDGGGRQLTSTEFAETIRDYRDRGTQNIVVGIGGADGWTAQTRARADLLFAVGRLTLPHSLARVVAAEQIYRAMTILAGHPYHCGH